MTEDAHRPDFDDDDDRPRPRRRRRDDDYEDDDDRPRPRRRRPPADEGDDQGLHYVIPVNTSGLAIAAGYMGLFSVLCLPAPFALLLGILALVQLKKKPKLHGHGRAIFAVVMGTLFTLAPLALVVYGALSK